MSEEMKSMRDISGNFSRDLVGYGKDVPAVRWPDDANVAVNIVVNYEEGSEYSHEMGDGQNDSLAEVEYAFPGHLRDLAKESMYEYGSRVGVWRLLRLFDDYDIKATFFACAVAFERNPEVATVAREAGHDLLAHGWRWEEHWRLTREEEADHIRRALASFKETWGEAPSGWYCRYGPSINTRELVVENGGFLYDSDAYNDDLPYYVDVKGVRHLVVPYSLTYNDIQGTRSPSLFLDYLKRGFDELWLEGSRGRPKMMSIGLHPRLIGQAARTGALREFIEYAQTKGSVWFARRSDIARWWVEHSADFVKAAGK
ncbi:polysaccharide deacetylase family protein [Streptomyces sp. NPDC005708]|uniref:polysaccharide deacetylase family protein n=1 Tax=Streptomyces sp. NPDC005708 TaxID=3154564 RepID=UPI0033E6E763